MPQEELDLLQLASRSMAEPSTGPSQIVWRQLRHADALGGFLHNVPNRLHRHAISPCPSNFVDSAEQLEGRSEEHTSELQSPYDLVCRLLLEKKKKKNKKNKYINYI